jgi:hypothetical protein
MVFRGIDDIEKDADTKERDEFKRRVVTDLNDVLNGIKKNNEQRKKKRKLWVKIAILLGVIGLLLLAINFVLVNVWLLKFFVKDLF